MTRWSVHNRAGRKVRNAIRRDAVHIPEPTPDRPPKEIRKDDPLGDGTIREIFI